MFWPEKASQSLSWLSVPKLTRKRPSEENLRPLTWPLWAVTTAHRVEGRGGEERGGEGRGGEGRGGEGRGGEGRGGEGRGGEGRGGESHEMF